MVDSVRNNIRIFWLTYIFEAKRFVHYPYELFFSFFNRLFATMFILVFWKIVEQYSGADLGVGSIVVYYLLAGALMRLLSVEGNVGGDVMKKIKFGQISSDLLRPVRPFQVMFARNQGWNVSFHALGLIMVAVGMFMSSNSINFPQLGLALTACIMASIALNMALASIAFYIVEARGVKNSVIHIVRFLSGWIVPLAVMPAALADALFLTPFPFLLYVPVRVLQGEIFSYGTLFYGILVCAVTMKLVFVLWNHSVKRYEAVGL